MKVGDLVKWESYKIGIIISWHGNSSYCDVFWFKNDIDYYSNKLEKAVYEDDIKLLSEA